MPRCGCAGSSCTCLVTGGEGIAVEGAGTADNPYIISTEGSDISGTVQFIDTPTIDFTVTGAGTEANPYQVSATMIGSLGDLSNVDCDLAPAGQTLVSDGEKWQCGLPTMALNDLSDVSGTPNQNEVLTWNGTGWVPGVVSVEPGQVNTDHGAAGDGTATNPVIVQTAAEWGAPGELEELPTGGQTQDGGIPVYIDSVGNVRTPRGLYVVQTDPATSDFDPYTLPVTFHNPASALLGSIDDPTYRVMAIARQHQTDASIFGGFLQFTTFAGDYTVGGLKVSSVSRREDPSDSDTEASLFYFRGDGQTYHREYDHAGVGTTRYNPFAFAQGTTFHEGPANDGRPVVVTFPTRLFTDAPRVFLQVLTGTQSASTTNTESWPSGITATSMTVYANRSNSTAIYVAWLAVQAARSLPALMQPRDLETHDPNEAAVQDGLATCHVAGCENDGVPIPVPTQYEDAGGVMQPLTNYECGACGTPITDVQAVS
jgi:hypothetical protein